MDWGAQAASLFVSATCRDVLSVHVRYAKRLPASRRQLQAGSLRSPDAERAAQLRYCRAAIPRRRSRSWPFGEDCFGETPKVRAGVALHARRARYPEHFATQNGLERGYSAVVSQVMKSSSDARVRATAKATTVASSRKPRKGTSSGIRSNGSTR